MPMHGCSTYGLAPSPAINVYIPRITRTRAFIVYNYMYSYIHKACMSTVVFAL